MDFLPFPLASLLAGAFITLLGFVLLLNVFGLPANWVLYQIMTFVKADTFEVYAKNMGQLMM